MFQSKYEWKVRKKTADIDDSDAADFKLNTLEQTILENRGYVNARHLDKIFKPKSHDASQIYAIDEAVNRINTAIKNDDSILIYGDFDADGITSTVLLLKALKKRTDNVDFLIPDRLTDGYGPNRNLFEEVAADQFSLVITVDNGISGRKEIDFLLRQGVDVIVCDHHTFGSSVPECIIIHPAHPQGEYPFNALAGVGITYKLTEALGLADEAGMSLAAIGTVADMVPLVDENKRLVIDGLRVLNDSPPEGIRALLNSSGHDGIIDEDTIGYSIAPRLNASGRLGEAAIAVELLIEEDRSTAYEMSMVLERMNQERKELVDHIYAEAEGKVDGQDQVNVIYGEGWHPGVIGIVASKLVDRFGKPAIVLTLDGEIYRGSARSIEGVDLHSVIGGHCKSYENFGGHSQALGIEVSKDDVEDFKAELGDYFNNLGLDLRPVKYIDYQLKPGNMTMKEFERFGRLKPFGQSFYPPLFMINNARTGLVKQVGKDKSHIKMTIPELDMDVIGFSFGHLNSEVRAGDTISLIGTVNINEFNQKRTLQMVLMDAAIDTVQIIDMRSKSDQNFDIISKDDVFLIEEGRETQGPNYYNYGERLPFVTGSVILRDLPASLDNLSYSLNDIHVSKIIMIFHSKTELFFTGIPNLNDVQSVYEIINSAEDGSIDLARHAPALSKKLGISMIFLKMTIDILEELKNIVLKNGIVYKVDDKPSWDMFETKHYRWLAGRMDAETHLKMSSANELKQYVRTLISN
ncbi:single-stranded-DNA-specific exonuclease RecJ [Salinicoccus albus]|uniref:single-stranded-DNA-specific exonuclease RecJ n=1 Tax=Salinicoccus albus TaxID=418756 RepID=UPI000381F70C|nr:single-stranded-DNA-specific exonuclease RecJ [Salinicoccus albus]